MPTGRSTILSHPSATVRSVTVIGAGTMGRGIALANARRNIPVTLEDTSATALEAGLRQVRAELGSAEDAHRLVRGASGEAERAVSDLIVESAIERLPVKQRIFANLEPRLGNDVLLASNTSSLSITRIAEKLVHPERFLGLHFCHPVVDRTLVEVIPGSETSPEFLHRAVDYVRQIGKLPIVVRDSPGFVVNRLLAAYLNEAMILVESGVAVEAVEQAALKFGMPIGPLSAIDAIGVDVVLRAGSVMYKAFPDRVVRSELLTEMYREGHLGQKSGSGFFCSDRKTEISPQVEAMLRCFNTHHKLLSADEIIQRLFLPMVVEACHLLDENVVSSPHDIDQAVVHGIGFPNAHGGLLGWADSVGIGRILGWLERLEPLGPRFSAGDTLRERAAEGRGFITPAANRSAA